jgi:O-acetyl-ADP-ribose deacetylase (regulator of RNase III)
VSAFESEGHRSRILVWRGDLTRLSVDAIVNAANESLRGGGGVDGAIHRAAGPRLLRACERIPQVRSGVRCPTGEARITPGFDLPARFVIHTVGPVWRGGTAGEPRLLASCYRSSLRLAAEHGLRTMAFPAISCGAYGYPLGPAAVVAIATAVEFVETSPFPDRVLFAAYDEPVERALCGTLTACRIRSARRGGAAMIQSGSVSADIRFDARTVERLFADPEGALADPERFWSEEEPMRCAKGWHDAVKVPVDWDHFHCVVEEITGLSPRKRAEHPSLAVTKCVMAQERRFLDERLAHLCSLLPGNPARLEIRILFTGGIRAYAFAWEQIVIDSMSKHWHREGLSIRDRASWILNLLVYECRHGGYSENRAQRTGALYEDQALYNLLDNTQDEGIGIYVNYTARSVFPARMKTDFQQLDDPAQVAAKLASMNDIPAKRRRLDGENLRKLAWDEGGIGRAFCIGGAHMARVLDERAGRNGLNETIAGGPLSFVELYSRLADPSLRVRLDR